MCFHRHQVKELVIQEARKRKNQLFYKDVPVRIYEDYTSDVQEERATYKDVMSKLYTKGLRPSLHFPARLQITELNGNKKRFDSPAAASLYLKSMSKDKSPSP